MVTRRNYKKEYSEFHSKPKQKKRRAQRNKARRKLTREGVVTKNDKKDVHHKDKNTKNNSRSNLSVTTRRKNRGKLR